MATTEMIHPKVVSNDEWLEARRQLLAQEKELTRRRDALNAERRRLPWVQVEKEYVFDTPEGKKILSDLFEGRSQLIVQHFMFGPGWNEGCVGCSFHADHVDGARQHLEQHDVKYVVVSRASLSEIEPFKQRMGWKFPWVSSGGSDFNYDFHVSYTPEEMATGKVFYNFEMTDAVSEELAGLSVFYKDADGRIFHTYSSFGRGAEEALGTYVYLDLTPKGRNENGPRHNLTDWVRHHDRYGAGGAVAATGRYVSITNAGGKCHESEKQL
jgi:predicted dithiol-disulfide oxidoreductase (DUF899 family)